MDTASRWSKKEEKYMDVSRPHIVKFYNSIMGEVDLLDMFLSLYNLEGKSRKWYIRIFYRVFSSAVISGWVRYKRDYDSLDHGNLFRKKLEKVSLLKYTQQLTTALIENAKPTPKPKSGRPSS